MGARELRFFAAWDIFFCNWDRVVSALDVEPGEIHLRLQAL